MRQQVLRVLAVLTVVAGVVYLVWRWSATIPWDRWWIGVPLALAETSTLVALGLLGLTMSRLRRSTDAPAPVPGTTVDVFVTTHDEPLDLVMGTVTAARDIRYPHRTWVLDDGARPELAAAVAAAGVEYVQRSADWSDRPRHAKAGNLNNALFQTEGEVLLVLEADRVPSPTTGWPWSSCRARAPARPPPTRSTCCPRCCPGRCRRARPAGAPPSRTAPTCCCAGTP
jgi:cellulose synthase (UDP-forming)